MKCIKQQADKAAAPLVSSSTAHLESRTKQPGTTSTDRFKAATVVPVPERHRSKSEVNPGTGNLVVRKDFM